MKRSNRNEKLFHSKNKIARYLLFPCKGEACVPIKQRKFNSLILPIIFLGLLVSACSVYEPEKRDLKPATLNEQFSLFDVSSDSSTNRWWEDFQNAELSSLIALGIENNLDIHKSRAQMKQAQAALEKVGGSVYPSVSAGLSSSLTQKPDVDDVESYSLNLSASYELDLWGRVDALVEAEKLDYQASQADLEAAAMSLAANIAETWLDIIKTRQEITIIRSQLQTNVNLLELLNFRFENAMADALDVLQQKEAIASTKASIPLLEAKEKVLLNNLAILLGKPSATGLQIKTQNLPAVPAFPAIGVPADLLENRPDIRSAGLNLKSSDWDIAAARANRLPSMSLSGSYAYSSSDFAELFDSWIVSLGVSLVASLYDGGTKSAEVRRLEAGVEAELSTYKQTVFKAVIEVENSIINEKKQVEYLKLLEEQLTIARQTLTEAERQYTNGLQSFIPVITEIPKVQSLEKQMIGEKTNLIKYRIGLYRALGGPWTRDWIASESNQENHPSEG